MSMNKRCMTKGNPGLWLTALAAAAIAAVPGATRADDEKPVEQRVQIILDAEGDTDEQIQIQRLEFDVEEVKPGKYWIGVVCSPLDNDLLQAHLNVDQGMVVTQVVEGSPAEKANLQKNDILLQVGDQPLTDLKVLVASTEKAQENEITLTIVRKGKRQEVKLTPAQRPAKYALRRSLPDIEAVAEWKLLQETLRKHGATPKAGEEDTPDLTTMMFVMPGFVLPEQAKGLPKNLEVTITKKGQQEAKITVKQGDKQWELDAKSLDNLPEDIRPHIEKMLGHGKEMRIHMGTDGFGVFGTTPKDLFAPRIIRKSLQIAPNKVYELHQLAPKLNKELRAKIHTQLKQAQRTLEEAKPKVPADALEKIETQLKALREQLEQLRDEDKDEEE